MVIILRAGMTLVHGKPWTPEIWKRVIPVFCCKNQGKEGEKNGETTMAGLGLQQMRKPAEQLGCPPVKGACLQVSML